MTIWKKLTKGSGNFSAIGVEHPLKVILGLHGTFLLAVLLGIGVIIGYAFHLKDFNCMMVYLLLLLALASFVSGFFLGFLFGVPKMSDDKTEEAYHPSTHLTEIADWLTKIIIGLGLVEIKEIPGALSSVGEFIQKSTQTEDSVKVFTVCCIIYFGIFGLYYGYNYTRLYLSAQYKGADEKLRDKLKFTEAEELLRTKKLGFLEKIDNPTRKNLEDYDQLLKKTKTEDEYTFEDWFYKGLLAFHSQQYNSAIGYMEEALSLDSECEKAPPANLNIGVAYKRLGLFEHALTIYRKIVKSYPQYDKMYKVYNNIGTALWGLRKADEALEAFDKALEIKPDNAPAFYNKACVYSGTKHKNKMLEYLQKAINIEEEFKIIALSDADFANYWDDDDFKNLV